MMATVRRLSSGCPASSGQGLDARKLFLRFSHSSVGDEQATDDERMEMMANRLPSQERATQSSAKKLQLTILFTRDAEKFFLDD